jgi:hypothetical protein
MKESHVLRSFRVEEIVYISVIVMMCLAFHLCIYFIKQRKTERAANLQICLTISPYDREFISKFTLINVFSRIYGRD